MSWYVGSADMAETTTTTTMLIHLNDQCAEPKAGSIMQSDESDDVSLTELLRWCAQKGIQAGGVRVASSDGCGRFLQATERFDPEQLILMVPAEAILAEGVGESNYQASHWMLGVAHRLLEEDCLKEASAFAFEPMGRPYVRLLFEGEPHGFGAMAALPGCVGSLARARETLRSSQVVELLSAMPDSSPERAVRALHTVDTRTVISLLKDFFAAVYSHSARVRALVPFFDFANHCAYPNARWTMGSDRVLRLHSTKLIDIGEEVTISYDNISNARLLVTYGFVLNGNGPHRRVDLDIVSVQSKDLEEAALDQKRRVQLEVLEDGCLRRRAALLPLANAFRAANAANADVLLAEHLLQQAMEERRQWEETHSRLQDSRFLVLSAMTIEVLGHFVGKLKDWMEDPTKTSLMVALGPRAEIHSDSSDSASGE